MASPFSPTVQAMGVTLGVDMSSVGETEVILLQQLLVVEAAIAGGGGGGGGITALTGDVMASGSGSVAATVAKIQGVAISGPAAAGNVLTASGTAAASWQAPSGGGTPGLPVWTFAAADSSDPASGKFTTDNAAPVSISILKFANLQKNGTNPLNAYMAVVTIGCLIVMTSSTGECQVFQVNTASPITGGVQYSIAAVAANGDTWSGDYQISFSPSQAGPTLAAVLAASSITPVVDGTTTPVTSVTTQTGIVTALS